MKSRMPVAIGLSSLLVIFAVLCLTVFSLLSLSTAKADARLADKSRQATYDYYEADCKAQEILSQIRAGQVPEGVTLTDGVYAYQCPISDTQILAVEVTVTENGYEILRWQSVSTTQWEADESLRVWQGA